MIAHPVGSTQSGRVAGGTFEAVVIILAALATLAAGGLAALAAGDRPRLANGIGSASAASGCLLGLAGLASIGPGEPGASLRLPWSVPYGEIHLEIDPLSAFFLLLVFGLCLAAALFGAGYLRAWAGRARLGPPWLFFNLLAASMAIVVMAADGVLFLLAWEVMALCSFFLVTFESDKEASRRAGWIYLVATHVGTVFLFFLFLLLARQSGSMDFARWAGLGAIPPATAGLLFLLAVVGFGTKAGIVPFHVWLPEAHPAAPAHVSAVMSGVMIKTGIYGLLRVLTFLTPAPSWWAMVLIAIGITSGLLGVLFAVAQADMKRVLAYSSVENVGIVFLGLGLGLLGGATGDPAMAALGVGGALLHVMNHALFKGLLFMGAGAVAHAAGTARIDRLGGILKRMPLTGAAILAGAAAISGLPPFNGFVGELLIYAGALGGALRAGGARALLPLSVLLGLGLVGGLAVGCFVRLAGACLLGRPRTPGPERAHEPDRLGLATLLALAALCLLLGLLPGAAVGVVSAAAGSVIAGMGAGSAAAPLEAAAPLAGGITRGALLVVALVAGLGALRALILRGRERRAAPTWDCGYGETTSRMQHTGASLARPFALVFPFVMPGTVEASLPSGNFPGAASLRLVIARPFQEWLYRPAFETIRRGMFRLRWLQHGRVQLYVLYIVVTLIALLSWFAVSR